MGLPTYAQPVAAAVLSAVCCEISCGVRPREAQANFDGLDEGTLR